MGKFHHLSPSYYTPTGPRRGENGTQRLREIGRSAPSSVALQLIAAFGQNEASIGQRYSKLPRHSIIEFSMDMSNRIV